MTYTIEKNVPRPHRAVNKMYPFGEMKPGDSFLCNGEDTQSVKQSAYTYAKAHGQKFSVLKTKEGYRCWRVS